MDGLRLFCYLVLLCAHVLTALAGLERTCTLSDFYENRRMQSRVSCSRRLPEMIKRLCRGPINIPSGSSIPVRRTRDTAAAASPSLEADGSIFLDKMSASKYLSKRDANGGSSGTQGIVCECCVHPCRRSELMQYCAPRTRRSADGFAALVKDRYDEVQVRKFYDELGVAAQPKRQKQQPGIRYVRGGSAASLASSAPVSGEASSDAAAAAAARDGHDGHLAADEPLSLGARWLPSN